MISRKLLTVFIIAGGIAGVLTVQAVFSDKLYPVQFHARRLKGSLAAEFVVFEFTDFQCPACAHAAQALEKMFRKHPGKFAVQHKHFPLSSHKNSFPAALFAECASRQGHFWPAHDFLFTTQAQWQGLAEPGLFFMQKAPDLGLDSRQLEECVRSPQAMQAIEADLQEGKRRRVQATPTFIVRDQLAVGFDDFRNKTGLIP